MPTLKAFIRLEIDGQLVDGYPLVKRVELDESQSFRYEEPDDADTVTFSAIPADQLDTISVLAAQTDQQVNMRFDGATDAGILVNAGGFILLFDVTIDAGAGASNASLNNNSGNTAIVRGIAGGT